LKPLASKSIIAAVRWHDPEDFFVLSRQKNFTTTKVFVKIALPGHICD